MLKILLIIFNTPKSQVLHSLLYAEKSKHVPIFDTCGTLKVNGGHIGNVTTCGISEKCCLCFVYFLYQISHFKQILHNNAISGA